MKSKFSTAQDYIKHQDKAHFNLLTTLLNLLEETELKESIKWGIPVFTLKNKNVIGLISLKSWVGLWFYQGSLLSDPLSVLVNAQEGKTQGMRSWKFKTHSDLKTNDVRAYIKEAIENQKLGKKVIFKKTNQEFIIPPLLKEALDTDHVLNDHYSAFSNYKQKEFAEYISEAKREATKQNRLVKILPMIKAGIGLNDKYRKK